MLQFFVVSPPPPLSSNKCSSVFTRIKGWGRERHNPLLPKPNQQHICTI